METAYLREYIGFARSLSYSKAAKEMFVSEPTLRSHIKALEDEAGVPLFIRQEGRLELSLAGKLYLKKAREIAGLSESMIAECRSLSRRSTSILAGTLGYPPLEELLAAGREQLGKSKQEVVIDLRFASSTYMNLATIVEKKADITLLPRLKKNDEQTSPSSLHLPAGIEAIYLRSEACSFWMTNENPLFEQETIGISELDGQSMLLGNTDNMVAAGEKFAAFFDQANVAIGIDHQPFASYEDYVFSAYFDGFGMFIEPLHPSLKTHTDRRAFSIEDLPLRFDMYAIFDRSIFDDIGLLYLQQIEELARAMQRAPAR